MSGNPRTQRSAPTTTLTTTRRGCSALLGLIAALVLLVGSTPVAQATAVAATDQMTTLAPASPKKVFAHYFTPYPISIDGKPAASDYYTRNYLTPNGEGGKHAAYGGLLRDRPSTPTATGTGWKLRNLETEVRQAKAAGIDGFTLDLLSASGLNWEASLNLMTAADRVGGFVIVPMVDATAGFARQTPAAAAAKINQLLAHPSAYRLGSAHLVSSFKAEGKPVSWWSSMLAALRGYGRTVTFQAVFLNASDANMRAFAPIASGFGNWGTRDASSIDRGPDYAARAHALGKTWMAPVAPQDARPNQYVYAEATSTTTLRSGWRKARFDGADFVQIVTWNDYSENTTIAPSRAHGNSFLDLCRFYTTLYKTGSYPAVTREAIYLTHRIQFTNATPTYKHRLMTPTLGGTRAAVTDYVEVVTVTRSAATVTVQAGSKTYRYPVAAGLHTVVVPLQLGAISTSVSFSDGRRIAVASPWRVVAHPYVQDLQYYSVSAFGG